MALPSSEQSVKGIQKSGSDQAEGFWRILPFQECQHTVHCPRLWTNGEQISITFKKKKKKIQKVGEEV